MCSTGARSPKTNELSNFVKCFSKISAVASKLPSYPETMLRQLRRQMCSQAQNKLQQVQIVKRFTQQDLEKFAQFTGDFNHIHSADVPVAERRVHGALLNAVVAGIIGTKLPGPGTVVLEQNFKFLKPCRIETDTIVTVRLLHSRKISTVEYECRQHNDVVFAGNAKLLTRKETS